MHLQLNWCSHQYSAIGASMKVKQERRFFLDSQTRDEREETARKTRVERNNAKQRPTKQTVF